MKRELEEIPNKIAVLEIAQAELHQTIGDPNFYTKNKAFITETTNKLMQVETALKQLYDLWEVLENLD